MSEAGLAIIIAIISAAGGILTAAGVFIKSRADSAAIKAELARKADQEAFVNLKKIVEIQHEQMESCYRRFNEALDKIERLTADTRPTPKDKPSGGW